MNRDVSAGEAKLKIFFYRLFTFVAITAVLTPFLNAISTRYVPGDSDGATVILEGLSISRGNWLLRGWSMSLDSFWTLDAMFNALLIKIVGFGPALLTLTPSFIAAMTIAAAVLLVYRPDKKPVGFFGPLLVLICLALPSPDLSYYFLQGPWHVATVLYCLAAFALLGRRQTWPSAVLATFILAIALLGDLLLVDFGVSAIVISGIVAMLRSRKFSAGSKTFFAGLLSMPLAIGLRLLADVFGTFELVNRNIPLKLSQIGANVGYIPRRMAAMFGVGSISSAPSNADLLPEVLRAVMLFVICAVVLFSLGNTVVAIFRGNKGNFNADPKEWHFNDLLLLGIFADFVTFIGGATSNNTQYSKYMDPAIFFAVVLTGRVLGYALAAISDKRQESHFPSHSFSSLRPIRAVAAKSVSSRQSAVSSAVGVFPVVGAGDGFSYPLAAQNDYLSDVGQSEPQTSSLFEPEQTPMHLEKEPAGQNPARGADRTKSFFGKKFFRYSFVAIIPLVTFLSLIAGAVQVKNEMALPAASQPLKGLVTYLEAKGLTQGVGAYWVSSIVTVESKGRVAIRPVTNAAADRLRRYGRQSTENWYAGHQFQFFIYNLYQPWRKVNTLSAEKTYGVPKTQMTDGPYRILMWKNPIQVSLVMPTIKNPLDIILRN